MGTAAAVDARSSHRSNVFLAAVIHAGGSCYPVRIRNLSETGALIEGKDMPRGGGAVRLQRGPHVGVATIVWKRADACGLRFASAVPVNEWISYGAGHKGQQRVDEFVARVRTGAPAGPEPHSIDPERIDGPGAARQLESISIRLAQAADGLAAIPAVVDQGLAALQELDLARQSIADLASKIPYGKPPR